MKIRILSVGKIKEAYLNDAIVEYSKRLSRYCKLEIVEVADEKIPENSSEAIENQIKETEGKRLLHALRDTDYAIALAIEGEMLDSVSLAKRIELLGVQGESTISFLIGGSLGLSKAVLRRADYVLSFSRLTFPHQIMRVLVLEQIYRSFRIIHGAPYHK